MAVAEKAARWPLQLRRADTFDAGTPRRSDPSSTGRSPAAAAAAPLPGFASPTVSSEQWYGEKAAAREDAARKAGSAPGSQRAAAAQPGRNHERGAHGSPLSLITAWEPLQKGREGAHSFYDVDRSAVLARTGQPLPSVPPLGADGTTDVDGHVVRGEPVEERLMRLGDSTATALERRRENARLKSMVAQLDETKRVEQARHAKNARAPRHATAEEAVSKRSMLMAGAGEDDGFAQRGPDGWGLELVAWREHSHRRRVLQGQRAVAHADAVLKEFETPMAPAMSPGSARICEKWQDFSGGGRPVGDRLHAAAHVQLARRESAATAALEASASTSVSASASPERQTRSPTRRSPPSRRRRASTEPPPLPSDPVGRERNARRQRAIEEELASISFSPKIGRSPSSPRRADASTATVDHDDVGVRLHESATEAQTRRAAMRREADAEARRQANPGLYSPRPVSREVSPSTTQTSWDDYDEAERAYDEEDYAVALLRARRLRKQQSEIDQEVRQQRFWDSIAEAERELVATRQRQAQAATVPAPGSPQNDDEGEDEDEDEAEADDSASDCSDCSDCGSFVSCQSDP